MNDNLNQLKKEDPFFLHLLRHQRKYLLLLLLLVTVIPLLSNLYGDKPLLMGGESYYYLSTAQEGLTHNPLVLLAALIPDAAMFLFPPILSVLTLLLFFCLAKKLALSETMTFYIGFFLILSPAFIFNSVTLSSNALFVFLLLLGFYLLLQENKKRYVSLLPLATAAFFDLFSSAVLLLVTISYFVLTKRMKEPFSILVTGAVAALLAAGKLFFNLPIILGPFHIQKIIPDLISDLGGLSGVGFFTLLLAIIGIIALWKKKSFLISLPLLALFIAAYLLNTQAIFFLSLFIVCYAAAGFAALAEQKWSTLFLKKATLFLLILGTAFSTVAYLDHVSEFPPSSFDKEFLAWMERNTQKEEKVLSAPENSYYIQYFARRQPVLSLHHDNYRQQINFSQQIFSSLYVQNLFPLLEASNVSIIYVTKEMEEKLPEDRGFIFLLQNERFKLLRSSGNAGVWLFTEGEE